MEAQIGDFVVVTTDADRRGVFGGTLAGNDGQGNVSLRDARMCVYWDRETRGVLGLAAQGPGAGCRITRAVQSIDLDGVTAIMVGSDAARAAWEAEPWG